MSGKQACSNVNDTYYDTYIKPRPITLKRKIWRAPIVILSEDPKTTAKFDLTTETSQNYCNPAGCHPTPVGPPS